MQQDERYIQNTSGVTDELMARQTNAVSGVAIQNRQEQGQVVTQDLFDNYRLAFQLSGEIQLSLIEQYWNDEKTFRIVGESNAPEFVQVNDPEGLNDITASQADFIISEQDYSATIRRAMFENLSEMMAKLPPEMAIQLLDLVFDLSDLPGKEKFVDRIRQINGQKDPNAKEDPNAPQEVDPVEQAKADAAQQQLETQNQILQTQLEGEQAKVAKLESDAKLVQAKIGTEMINQRVAAAGVEYDQEKLKIERAQTLNAIESAEHGRRMMEIQQKEGDGVSGDSAPVKRDKGQRGSTERGLKTNNQSK